jgi:transcriptional regulator with XRE-family HTH domain
MKNHNHLLLGSKLKTIRVHLGYTFDEMASAIGKEGASKRSRIFEWEANIRDPDLDSLLRYSRLSKIKMEDLVDDEVKINL